MRVISEGNFYNGPDFKLVGSAATQAKVPVPFTLLGLGVVAAGALLTRCRRLSQEA